MQRGRAAGGVRIIGGSLRGRRLRFPAGSEVRPTPDRVRETVFNWLGPVLIGSRCLDLFAGTGAFGFEALSRGAATVVLVEQDPKLVAALTDARRELEATNLSVLRADVTALLAATDRIDDKIGRAPFDFIALDPPYRVPVAPMLDALLPRLAPAGRLYVERPIAEGLPDHSGLEWRRRQRAGRIEFGLATRAG